MAIELAELIAKRDKLILDRARGLKSAQINEERIEFRSDAEMALAIADLEARIRRASSPAPAPNAVRFSTSKGF
ncbi:phage head-tail joining protein [Paenirhodobacter enshiensis]|uniref:Uncharacterized protein n=1 Tax=Paenirhodobacter enshiensis TaxID=1105367 RepID=A0A086Y1L2_9RHOB|nr:hypothetical protein [Paenirhodobacter enshiensis]KFI28162.1 hypothetical protein CG50_14830 [Paenirhodobacter enshiensis]